MADIQQLDPRSHVLQRPAMYIGPLEKSEREVWVMDEESKTMQKRSISFSSALMKIVDEILVNALDRVAHNSDTVDALAHKVSKIHIDIGEDGVISVLNNGDGLSSGIHAKSGLRIPQLAFGEMLTSTNYDDSKERITGGMNGIGSKACNIFSKRFHVETVDHVAKKLYKQEWRDNMSACGDPKITACKNLPYTKITFLPDYERFGMEALDADMRALLMKRAYDACAVTDSSIAVSINKKPAGIKTFQHYADLFIGKKDANDQTKKRAYERFPDPRGFDWEVLATSWDTPEQVSFVNGVSTILGGKHVDYVVNQIARKTADVLNKRSKDTAVKPQHVRDRLFVIIKSTIPNPVFNGQTKEYLETPSSKFGRKVDVSDAFVEYLVKNTDIARLASSLASVTQAKAVKKTDGSKRNVVHVPKLDDANWAGTAKSRQCTLILTEGDSAKTMAISGLSVVGRDQFGVFPLRGKLLNVRDVAIKRIADNEEISNIKKILGLESNRTYESADELRYGRVMVLADQDVDGSHIKGLLINVFSTLWPSLFKIDGFLASMATPIVKVKKGRQETAFYNLAQYDEWREAHGSEAGWSVKYYKGLGTSTTQEAKEYFRQMRATDFVCDDQSFDSMDLAFNKKRADDRKAWLKGYDKARVLREDHKTLTHKDFVDKELIHFSNYDLERSLPSAIDGLKISQRKIMFSCFKRKLTSEIRVAQLAGYVSEHAAYHHGETSLQGAIVGLAQRFVGSNNVNLLQPNGQFGTRIQGGKDCASARYIHTELAPAAYKIFRTEDAPVLQYRDDDGVAIEPVFYVPIIPLVLVNGAEGIGTGFSTCIPCFDPLDVLDNTRRHALGERLVEMAPKYRGFKGTIDPVTNSAADGGAPTKRWKSSGIVNRVSEKSLEIVELPIGTWTEDYKTFLEAEVARSDVLKSVDSHYTERDVKFILRYATAADALAAMESNALKLTTSPKNLWMTNVHLFCAGSVVTKYDDLCDIIAAHGRVRLDTYNKRRAHQIGELEKLVAKLGAKARFVREVIEGRVVLLGRKRMELEAQLFADGYPDLAGLDYLVQMPISSLTQERREQLEREAAAKAAELEAMRGVTATDMWLSELDELRAELVRDSGPDGAGSAC
jgi:DNA topoisomerase-2